MTSLMMTKYGNINESLEFQKVSKPTIGTKQILIKTKAASYNPLDYKIIRGDFKSVRKIDFPKGIGRDVSGVVEEIGPDVEGFKCIFPNKRRVCWYYGRVCSFKRVGYFSNAFKS